jgi:pilus assembly protein CpaE
VREFLVRPLRDEELKGAVNRIIQTQQEGARQGELISVIGSAGGVGATTIATNLAVELTDLQASRGRPRSVVLVDLDFRFGQVAMALDLTPSFTIADLCETHEHLDHQMIDKAVQQHECGLGVLARPNTFEQADVITAAHAVSVLGALQEHYDFVVVDGPGRFDPSARAVLDIADRTFLIVQLMVPSIRNASRILDAIAAAGFNMQRVQLLCNRTDKDSGLMTIEHVETSLSRDVSLTVPSDFKAVCGCQNMGEPLITSHSRSRTRMAIRELAESIIDPQAAAERDKHGKGSGGLLRKLVGASPR